MRPFLAVALLPFAACSSVDVPGGVSADAAGAGDGAPDARYDAPPQWQEVGSFPSTDMERYAQGAVFEGDLIIARVQDPIWHKRFDPDTGTVVGDLPVNDDLCNCGYSGTLTVHPTSDRLFYFGNMGRSWQAGATMWTEITSYPTYRRGEPATTVHQGMIWFVGGRDTPTTSLTYDPGSMVWTPQSIQDYPWNVSRAGAVSLDGVLYVLGGYADGSEKHMASFNGSVWTVLPDLPFTAGQPYVGALQGKIVLLDEGAGLMGVYDPAGTTWSTVAVPEGGGDNAILMTDGDALYVAYNVLSTLKIARFIGTL